MLVSFTSEEAMAAGPRGVSDALEREGIVHFPRCPIALPSEDDLSFLRDGLAPHLKRKNVSWYFASDALKGLETAPEVAARAHRLLKEHAARVREFVSRAMPEFTRGMTPGTTSMRPLQERGRQLSAHASNELIHVDAGAYGATHGDRVLRFFVNVNPREDRVWITKGAFAALYKTYADEAGLRPGGKPPPLDDGPLDRAYTALVRGAMKLAPQAVALDTSPYDRWMRRFHNWMKDTPSFRDSREGLQELRFAPGAAWMVLTDQLSHACIEGQHALVDTFIVPLANCRFRALSPRAILAGEAAVSA
ncbi:MAG: Kdo hydroxylase family protein [Deltaproteobacteria bacterium]|nr:Kdo hydroxylase family protein [Deltaproteobacteria bacterium]